MNIPGSTFFMGFFGWLEAAVRAVGSILREIHRTIGLHMQSFMAWLLVSLAGLVWWFCDFIVQHFSIYSWMMAFMDRYMSVDRGLLSGINDVLSHVNFFMPVEDMIFCAGSILSIHLAILINHTILSIIHG